MGNSNLHWKYKTFSYFSKRRNPELYQKLNGINSIRHDTIGAISEENTINTYRKDTGKNVFLFFFHCSSKGELFLSLMSFINPFPGVGKVRQAWSNLSMKAGAIALEESAENKGEA